MSNSTFAFSMNVLVNTSGKFLGRTKGNNCPGSRDLLGRPRAEINVLVGPRTAIVIVPIEFCLSDLRRADGDCRDEPTDDVIMSMISRRRCQNIYIFLLSVFIYFLHVFVYRVKREREREGGREREREREREIYSLGV